MKTPQEIDQEVFDMDADKQEKFLNDTLSVKVLDAVQTDDSLPDAKGIYDMYHDADDNGKEIIDMILIRLCGWSFHSLIRDSLVIFWFKEIPFEEALEILKDRHDARGVYNIDDDGVEGLIETHEGDDINYMLKEKKDEGQQFYIDRY